MTQILLNISSLKCYSIFNKGTPTPIATWLDEPQKKFQQNLIKFYAAKFFLSLHLQAWLECKSTTKKSEIC
jgi:hypothetical protein